ncbi:hypothetical protein DyAD56_15795 [Dyella sp. AD56]|uniref:hypothetical protein n=1 Tax=Dyella sp. AD56 TaxID=1528744 RepID=UPI000C84EA00|nr:hypothetical protein [Dyella sp. AD56]PMQ04150.1 hypothetical protein DyAD56_15795 [Dyella sp. AD56]
MTIFFSKSTNGFYDDAIHAVAEMPSDIVEVDPAVYTQMLQKQALGYTVGADSNGNPISVAPPPAVVTLVPAARQALAESDLTVLRCYEKAISVPADWVAYRDALRAIVSGGNSTSLPSMPAYPSGS